MTKIPTSLCLNNIKHVKLIRATLKTYRTYANEISYQIDHDFRNLTKLVWHFCDFSTLFGGFMKFLQIRKRKMKFPPSTGLHGQPAAMVAQAGQGARARP